MSETSGIGLLKSYPSLANLKREQGTSSSLTLLNVSQESPKLMFALQ